MTKPAAAVAVPIFLQRRTIFLSCAVVALVTLFASAGAAGAEVVYRLLTDGALLLAWLIAAGGIGGVFLRRLEPSALKVVTSIALGLGILGLVTLGLGLIGWLSRATAFGLIAIGVSMALMLLRGVKLDFRSLRARQSGWAWLWIAAAPIVGLVIFGSLAPPGFLWGDEPHEYDVLEYHLQIPREWYEAGRITQLEHNAFCYFPQGVEIHYLLAMHLRGGPWAGMYLAQQMHAAMTLLTAAAVFAIAVQMAPRAQATVAGVAAITVPWIALLAPMGYNEGGLLFFGTLAIGWTVMALREGATWRDVTLGGVMAGFACGAKLTAGPLLLAGLPVAGLVGRLRWPRAVVIALVGFAVFSPWAIRTFAWTGNPVFPEVNAVFKSPRFDDVQNERWKRAHAPTAEQRSIAGRLRAAGSQIGGDWRFGYLLLPAAVIAAVLGRRRRETRLLAAMLGVQLIFWLFFTHLQGRFFVLAIPTAALLLTLLERRAYVIFAAIVVVAQSILTIGFITSQPRFEFARESRALGVEQVELLLPQEMQDAIKSGAAIELVGDAQAFRYPVPMSQLRYRTVFDIKPTTTADDMVATWLGSPRRAGAYIFLHLNELLRLHKTYHDVPLPSIDPNTPLDRPLVIPP